MWFLLFKLPSFLCSFLFVCLEVLNVWKLVRKGRKRKGFRQRRKIEIAIEKGVVVELDLSFTRIITRVITITVVCVFTPKPKPKAPLSLWRAPASSINKRVSVPSERKHCYLCQLGTPNSGSNSSSFLHDFIEKDLLDFVRSDALVFLLFLFWQLLRHM